MMNIIKATMIVAVLLLGACIESTHTENKKETEASIESVGLDVEIILGAIEVDSIYASIVYDGETEEEEGVGDIRGDAKVTLTFDIPKNKKVAINYICYRNGEIVARNSETITLQQPETLVTVPDTKASTFFTGNDTTLFVGEKYVAHIVVFDDDSKRVEYSYSFDDDDDFGDTYEHTYSDVGEYLVITQADDGYHSLFDTVEVTVINYYENSSEDTGDGDSVSSSDVEMSSSSIGIIDISSSSRESSSSILSSSSVSSSEVLELFTVTFDSKEGSAVDAIEVEEGQKAVQPTNPTRKEYLFSGWFVGGTDTEWDFNENSVSENITLSAHWDVEVFPVSAVVITSGANENFMTLNENKSISYRLEPYNATNKKVTLRSSNTDVVTVNSNGLITSAGVGKAIVSVTSDDGGLVGAVSVGVNIGEITVASGVARRLATAVLRSNDVVVAYENGDNSEFSIYTEYGVEKRKNVNLLYNTIEYIDLAPIGDGDFVAVYKPSSGYGEFVVSTSNGKYTKLATKIGNGDAYTSLVTECAAGGFAIAYMVSGEEIVVQKYTSEGAMDGTPINAGGRGAILLAVEELSDGNLVVFYSVQVGYNQVSYQGRYTIVNPMSGAVVKEETSLSSYMHSMAIESLNGKFVIAYRNSIDGYKGVIQLFSNAGVNETSPIVYDQSNASNNSSLVELDDGNFILGYSNASRSYFGCYRKYSASGSLIQMNGVDSVDFKSAAVGAVSFESLSNGNVFMAFGDDVVDYKTNKTTLKIETME
ncbi:MAG: InlB B-repeat-containing protein [Fibrobacterales bacterium]